MDIFLLTCYPFFVFPCTGYYGQVQQLCMLQLHEMSLEQEVL